MHDRCITVIPQTTCRQLHRRVSSPQQLFLTSVFWRRGLVSLVTFLSVLLSFGTSESCERPSSLWEEMLPSRISIASSKSYEFFLITDFIFHFLVVHSKIKLWRIGITLCYLLFLHMQSPSHYQYSHQSDYWWTYVNTTLLSKGHGYSKR